MDEDDRLKQLFDSFNPDLGSDDNAFMERMRCSLEAVETAKAQNKALRSRSRMAVAVAALAGFAAGVVMTLMFPMLAGWMSMLSARMAVTSLLPAGIDMSYVTWSVTAVGSVLIALNTYEIMMSGHLRAAVTRAVRTKREAGS